MKTCVRANGFTLLELMVALVVVSILLTVGLPSFSASVRQNCTITAANTMLTVLTAARSEALKRDRLVAICKSRNGKTCASDAPSWEGGYVMYVDNAPASDFDDMTDQMIRGESPLSTCAAITSGENFIRYKGLGNTSDNSTFRVVSSGSTPTRRNVVISVTGRPRVCTPSLKTSGLYEC